VLTDGNGVLAVGTAAGGSPMNVNLTQIAGTPIIAADPCEYSTGITVSDSITTSTTIVTGTAAKQLSICGMGVFVSGTATNVAVIEGNTSNIAGTTAQCGTNTAKLLWGGTTANGGTNLTANQGYVLPASHVAYATESRAADNICILSSTTQQINYWIRYVVPGS
jgi:hypothetical protein